MKYDPRMIKQCKKIRAKKMLEDAISAAIDAGFRNDELCKILADSINRTSTNRSAK